MLTVSWVYEHTRDDAENRLSFVKLGKYVRFDRTDLREYIDAKRQASIAGDDFTKLLQEVDEPYRMMIGLIAATGLRIGELLALRWRNLDLTIGTLSVRESVFEGRLSSRRRRRRDGRFPSGHMRSRC